jgi:hypothetical protein
LSDDTFYILQFLTSERDWERIAKRFEVKCNFPNCLGAVYGKHVTIAPPPGAGSYFFKYKSYNIQALIEIADPNYGFIYTNFDTNGRVSDGGVFEYADFYNKLQIECLKIPESSDVKGKKLPHFFVGDEAFSLRKDFLKPYNVKQLTTERKIFSCRLSRVRRIVENIFGILVARFGIFKTHIDFQLDNIKYVMASCALDNFLRRIFRYVYTIRIF